MSSRSAGGSSSSPFNAGSGSGADGRCSAGRPFSAAGASAGRGGYAERSRGGRGRFGSEACANRTNVAAFRARRRT
ncbi:CGNR zinc finger domain-containing protein [Actinomadura sp. BRA 177]|uniref:CGNR zinc finger domain-containing protein n=1 Tax=Actinomadura sp. BRA 177 TaxID=2745202 RepID=UPI002815DC9C|nr:CGNR zinc finger domain-containing protein [Actinomadura sp. BRA 177]